MYPKYGKREYVFFFGYPQEICAFYIKMGEKREDDVQYRGKATATQATGEYVF
jgi:hypothetical protein